MGLIQPGKFLARVRGRNTGDGEDRTNISRAGPVQERLEQPTPHHQETPKDGLLDLRNRLLLVGGVVQVLDHVPERLEPLVDVPRASGLRGGQGERKLDGGSGGGQPASGSSSVREVRGPKTSSNIPHGEGPFEDAVARMEILKY